MATAHELDDLNAIIADEKDKWLWADKRALKIIKERIQWLKEDRANAKLARDTGCPVPPTKAKGRTDRRLALLRPSEGVEDLRIAWRTDANFGSVPTLMLDAGRDRVVTSTPQGRLCAAMIACKETRYSEAGHDLHMESDAIRGAWMTAIVNFTRTRMAAKALPGKG